MDEAFMREALRLAAEAVRRGDGGPFGAVVVRDGGVIGRGWNRVVGERDPTAHAEMLAIRDACRHVGDFRLSGAALYTSCEPCPMCLSAVYWARLDRIFYAAGEADAAVIGFDDRDIRLQLALPPAQRRLFARQLLREEALVLLRRWAESGLRVDY